MAKKIALISVSDKTGIENFARGLIGLNFQIISTGGTAKLFRNIGIPVTDVSEYTGFPEMLDGRVKTLHPKVHAALLAKRNVPEHMKQIEKYSISLIDLVVVNLYPFKKTIEKEGVTLEEAIENIDIGGPTMLRSASKNYESVGVVVKPEYYPVILEELKTNNGELTLETKFKLACEVFRHTFEYDHMIFHYLADKIGVSHHELFPDEMRPGYKLIQKLRYGENPHQKAAFYKGKREIKEPNITDARVIQGKELSFNNILDLNSSIEIIKEFKDPASIIIKHNNPCGAALGTTIREAYKRALETDPVSAFGSVVSFNRIVDKDTANEMIGNFVEAIVAPSFTRDALEIFKTKPNIRILELGEKAFENIIFDPLEVDIKKVTGGILIQERDILHLNQNDLKVVTKRHPTEKEMKAMLFAWKVCKHVKSNAIVYANEYQTVGIGAGQMSRVDSSRIAVMKARLEIKGTVLASDAFFPFRDGIDEAHKAGAAAVIQPGGSLKDKEVIDACNEYNMAMVFTGIRHFKH
ncbi:MAG: bifunctional phosphoribosylaminoimidazolecarboxamide formyltransferase/IMP cyclohydrolase [Candidatus Firestonebacteria bacterium]|nr:bifunctional phosphoribosylaminoimidazolecarboxamide formyltransferase/IMP cyclohydrolase [Candidatus Firestonebacteria bacterium]